VIAGDARSAGALLEGAAILILRRSRIYETRPWGLTDQPGFLNAAITVQDDPASEACSMNYCASKPAWPTSGGALGTTPDRPGSVVIW
jgi:hypothetical protein